MNYPPVIDFPKIKSPFKRVLNEKDEYLATPEIEQGYEWVFENGVRAVDKLHGTNICVHIKNGSVVAIDKGLIFVHPDGRMAKLRRDMFDWFEGPRHGE